MALDPANPAASRLNHLGLVYAGALAELGHGHRIAFLPNNHPGLPIVRDLIQLALLQRAEINGLTKLLLDNGLATADELRQTFEDEYTWLAEGKAKELGRKLGVEIMITDEGLQLRRPGA